MNEQDKSRYEKVPHNYQLHEFTELPPRLIGPDGLCTCTCADYCPLGKKGSEMRCSLKELRQLDGEAMTRRGYQSGDD